MSAPGAGASARQPYLMDDTMPIHPTAIVDPKAELDSSVEVGPYVIIDGPVKIGAHTRIGASAQITGWTEIGDDCRIYPMAVIGGEPQDFHYHGERSYCRLGNRVMLREGASVHRGSLPDSATVVGDDTVLLTHAHVGHNCEVGRGVQIQHAAALAGHVEARDGAIIAAGSMVHQFVRLGHLCFIAGMTRVTMDVPPFFMCYGEAILIQHNPVGMRRAGYSREAILEVREAFRTLYRSGLLFRDALAHLEQSVRTNAGRILVDFLKKESKRGIAAAGRPGRQRMKNTAEDTNSAVD